MPREPRMRAKISTRNHQTRRPPRPKMAEAPTSMVGNGPLETGTVTEE